MHQVEWIGVDEATKDIALTRICVPLCWSETKKYRPLLDDIVLSIQFHWHGRSLKLSAQLKWNWNKTETKLFQNRFVSLFPCSWCDQITTSSRTENSRNWDTQFVEITWCQAVDCLVHQKTKLNKMRSLARSQCSSSLTSLFGVDDAEPAFGI